MQNSLEKPNIYSPQGKASLEGIAAIAKENSRLNLTSLSFDHQSNEASFHFFRELGENLHNNQCEYVEIGKVFNKFRCGLQNAMVFLEGLTFIDTLSLEGMGVGTNQDNFKKYIATINCNELDLSTNHLIYLKPEIWEHLINTVINVNTLILTKNNLSEIGHENLHSLLKLINNKDVDLNGNGFETCSDEQWDLFCNELIKQKTIVRIQPIQGISKEREQKLNDILYQNACSDSLNATVKYKLYLWQQKKGITPINFKPRSPAIST